MSDNVSMGGDTGGGMDDGIISDLPDIEAIADELGVAPFEVLATTDPVLRRLLDEATARILASATRADRSCC